MGMNDEKTKLYYSKDAVLKAQGQQYPQYFDEYREIPLNPGDPNDETIAIYSDELLAYLKEKGFTNLHVSHHGHGDMGVYATKAPIGEDQSIFDDGIESIELPSAGEILQFGDNGPIVNGWMLSPNFDLNRTAILEPTSERFKTSTSLDGVMVDRKDRSDYQIEEGAKPHLQKARIQKDHTLVIEEPQQDYEVTVARDKADIDIRAGVGTFTVKGNGNVTLTAPTYLYADSAYNDIGEGGNIVLNNRGQNTFYLSSAMPVKGSNKTTDFVITNEFLLEHGDLTLERQGDDIVLHSPAVKKQKLDDGYPAEEAESSSILLTLPASMASSVQIGDNGPKYTREQLAGGRAVTFNAQEVLDKSTQAKPARRAEAETGLPDRTALAAMGAIPQTPVTVSEGVPTALQPVIAKVENPELQPA